VAEGVEAYVLYQGSLEEVVFQNLGGLRAGLGYVGAASIEELHEKARFRRMTQVGLSESHPHNLIVIESAPNYRSKS